LSSAVRADCDFRYCGKPTQTGPAACLGRSHEHLSWTQKEELKNGCARTFHGASPLAMKSYLTMRPFATFKNVASFQCSDERGPNLQKPERGGGDIAKF
jgi:hypothetical protein